VSLFGRSGLAAERPGAVRDVAGRRRLKLARHSGTTNNVCSLYPASIQAPLGDEGPMLGVDLTAGGAPHCWDPFESYDRGHVNNANTFVLGEPGFAKSSLVKCLLSLNAAVYGPGRWSMILDPKGEYLPFAEAQGLAVVRLAPGGHVRLNPLDGGATADSQLLERRAVRQSKMVIGLSATVLGRELTPLERKVVRASIDVLAEAHSASGAPTLPDFVRLVANPPTSVCQLVNRSPVQLARDSEELLLSLDELLTGTLRGMFDGPTSVDIDWDGPGLVLDLSGVLSDPQALPLAMVAATAWMSEIKQVRGRQRLLVLDEAYYQLANRHTVSFVQETFKLGRQFGTAPIAICHRPSDLAAQADDGTAVAKIAQGLLSDAATKIVFRQAPGELLKGQDLLGLSDGEVEIIRSLRRGNAVWKVGDRSLVARHLVPPGLEAVVNTDQFMRRPSLVEGAVEDVAC